MDENEVQINSTLLEKIRAREEKSNVNKQSGSGVSDGYVESRTSSNGAYTSSDNGFTQRDANRETRATEVDDVTNRLHQRVRPPVRPSFNTDKGPSSSTRQSEQPIAFRLKSPFKGNAEPTKLFTKQESDDELERLSSVYFHGSGLLDDVLQIIVKGHEQVQIWQLEQSEADQLASIHLSRAQVDKQAAASARALLRLYDRLYMWMLVLPRAKATATHVQEHGGLSFR